MASSDGNPWKAATFALAGVMVGALATAGVFALHEAGPPAPQAVAEQASPDEQMEAAPQAEEAAAPAPDAAASEPPAGEQPAQHAARSGSSTPVQRVAARPAAADIATCNRYATSRTEKAKRTLGSAVVGGAIGAALGAAGGAIADGGSGAGKGAGIGGLVGVAAGTAYGINRANQADARAEAAYRECMQHRGYTSYAKY